jgi:hypothetical protein
MQLGYFVGATAGGAALALGGYGALGGAMGLLFASAALALAAPAARPDRRTAIILPGG